MKLFYDLIVIGAGPAGLTAARAAIDQGLDTLVIDDQPAPGGNVYRNIQKVAAERPADFHKLGASYTQGRALVEEFCQLYAQHYVRGKVWHLDKKPTVGVIIKEATFVFYARKVVVAAGAVERAVPVPGWTLPGVMTAGAAQTLLKTSGLVARTPVVLAGSGPLVLLLAQQFRKLKIPVAAIVLTTPVSNIRRALPLLPRAFSQAKALFKGFAWMCALRTSGIRVFRHATALKITGNTQATGLEFITGGQSHRIDCNLVLLHEGVRPNTQLTMVANCRHFWDEQQAAWRPKTDQWGRTSHEHIYAAGDAAQILGADAAPLSGEVAGLSVALDLDKGNPGHARERRDHLTARLSTYRNLRDFLDALYLPDATVRSSVPAAAVVCRCENVTAGEIRSVARLGVRGPNQAKAFTRAGMGPCQGRMCALTVTEILSAELGISPEQVGYGRIRSPIFPITVGQLASIKGSRDAPHSTRMYASTAK